MFKSKFATITATFLMLSMTDVAAGQYDGLYYPEGMNSTCDPNMIGSDGGPLLIQNGGIQGVESFCRLKNPTTVRGMNATLFDEECSGEGETWSSRTMFMWSDQGLYKIGDGFTVHYLRCK